jgi:arylsulfatase A-like enzyme
MRRILGAGEGDGDELRQALATYYAMTMAVDAGLGRLLDRLDALGLAEDTIIVFCADHGDFSGEHAMMNKGGLFYDCLTRVPLVVRWPGHLPAGERVSDPVNLIDIVPTLFALQGLSPSPEWEGGLLPRAVAGAPGRGETFSLYGAGGPPFRLADLDALGLPRGNKALMGSLVAREAEGDRSMIRTRRHKFVHDPSGADQDELYDLATDPHEIRNLAGQPACAGIEADLKMRLLAFRRRPFRDAPQFREAHG